jgi:putative DNA primase/helicase
MNSRAEFLPDGWEQRPHGAWIELEPEGGNNLNIDDDQRIVPAPTNPMAVARLFIREYYTDDSALTLLRHHRGAFYSYSGTGWPEAEDRGVRSAMYRWLEPAKYWKSTSKGDELVPFEPTKFKVADLVDAVQAACYMNASTMAPAWLDDAHHRRRADEFVALANGLLHLPTRELVGHTPSFFSHHCLPFAYEPLARTPARWDRFLRELWDDDDETIDVLAEIMGYVLAGGTSQQKLFMMVGPKRSGRARSPG